MKIITIKIKINKINSNKVEIKINYVCIENK